MTYYIVWNESKTEGFVTSDKQLAYEVRKSSSTNCYDIDGNPSLVAVTFCETWYEDNCTIEVVGEEIKSEPRPISLEKSLAEQSKLLRNSKYGIIKGE